MPEAKGLWWSPYPPASRTGGKAGKGGDQERGDLKDVQHLQRKVSMGTSMYEFRAIEVEMKVKICKTSVERWGQEATEGKSETVSLGFPWLVLEKNRVSW